VQKSKLGFLIKLNILRKGRRRFCAIQTKQTDTVSCSKQRQGQNNQQLFPKIEVFFPFLSTPILPKSLFLELLTFLIYTVVKTSNQSRYFWYSLC